jgi:hypothetical protein
MMGRLGFETQAVLLRHYITYGMQGLIYASALMPFFLDTGNQGYAFRKQESTQLCTVWALSVSVFKRQIWYAS